MIRDVDQYLTRIGWSDASAADIATDLETLTALQLAHLESVPFEALEVFAGRPVQAADEWAWNKIVRRQRGGWCFEANGAFAQLLSELGFAVQRLGAAVLLAGPTTMIDHLVLEVMLDEPYLVEVGFGDRAPITPLRLSQRGPIDSVGGVYEFLDSPQGTTLAQHVDGVPEALYRFKRVNHELSDFTAASERLQQDKTMHWSTSPFATRLVDDAGTRMTLTRNALKVVPGDGGDAERTDVAPGEWNAALATHFGIVESFTPAELTAGAGDAASDS